MFRTSCNNYNPFDGQDRIEAEYDIKLDIDRT